MNLVQQLKKRQQTKGINTINTHVACAKSGLLDTWISEYVSSIEKTIADHRSKWVNQWKNSERGLMLSHQCVADEDTVIATFESLFHCEWTTNFDSKLYSFKIVNFNKTLLCQLWNFIKTFNWFSNKKLQKRILKLAKKIIDHGKHCKCYSIDSDQRTFIFNMLTDMRIYYFTTLSTSKKMTITEAEMAAVVIFGSPWGYNVAHKWTFMEKQMSSNEKYQVLQWIMKYNHLYWKVLQQYSKEEIDRYDGYWIRMLKFVMKCLDLSDFVKSIEEYKSRILTLILFDTQGINLDWVIDIVVNQCGSKQQRDIALIIVDFVTCKAKIPQDVVTEKYIRFVEGALDLKWHQAVIKGAAGDERNDDAKENELESQQDELDQLFSMAKAGIADLKDSTKTEQATIATPGTLEK